MYNWAIQNDIVEANPVAGVAKPGREQSRERVLLEDEIRRFFGLRATHTPRVAAWCRLRLTTAQRGSELLKMRWQDIEGGWWTIPGEFVKNGQGHRAYLNETSRSIVASVPKTQDSEWVFPPALMGDYRHVSRRIAKESRAAIEDFRGHDLRRTAASYMTNAGVPRQAHSESLRGRRHHRRVRSVQLRPREEEGTRPAEPAAARNSVEPAGR
jgi:integrase